MKKLLLFALFALSVSACNDSRDCAEWDYWDYHPYMGPTNGDGTFPDTDEHDHPGNHRYNDQGKLDPNGEFESDPNHNGKVLDDEDRALLRKQCGC